MGTEWTESLQAILRDRLGESEATVEDLTRLTGGASRETWSLRFGDDRFVLQRQRAGAPADRGMHTEAELLVAAAEAGVPVAELVAASDDRDEIGAAFLLSRFVEGETIARKIQRDDEYAEARDRFAADCGAALAAVHAIPPGAVTGLERNDQVAQYRDVLDAFGDPHPVFEHAFRWLDEHRPAGTGETVVHGDFRLGNLMVGPDGLRAVVDWELAHLGDPMEDLGWLCVRAWRFGGEAPVGGLGAYEDLFAAYEKGSGVAVDPDVVRWWEVLGTLKWGIMCIMQARAHLDGMTRSMELAAIGRRVCENEHDLLLLLEPDALARAAARPEPAPATDAGMHGRPTAVELLDAVRGWVADDVRSSTSGRVAFHTRVAENLLATLEREASLGPSMARAHADRLRALGVDDDATFASRVRDGSLRGPAVVDAMAETTVDKLRVANPRWFARN